MPHNTVTKKEYSKVALWIFYGLCITFILFLVTFFGFLFTLNSIFGIISIVLICLVFLEFIIFFRQQKQEPVDKLLQLHAQRKDLLFEKNILLKQFFKRNVDPKNFEETLNRIESQLLDVDYRIQSCDLKGINKETELKERIKILNKKFLKHEISQELFDKINSELNRELSYLQEAKKLN